MMRGLCALSIACALNVLAGCASPSTRLYTLSTVPMPDSTPSGISVAVGPVSVPATVDRPQIVITTGVNQVELSEANRWASPLQDSLSRVIAGDLSAYLGAARVTASRQPLYTEVDYRVQVEVRRFESALGKEAVVDAAWTVCRTRDGKCHVGYSSAREAVDAQGFDVIAAAHSRAVARLSEEIAIAVRALDRKLP